MRGGRKLGIAEFGTPDGQPVVWFHGTPGARRQIPEEARRLADARGLRIVGIDRPGVGLSTTHLYEDIFDFVPDLEMVVDQLGHRAVRHHRPLRRRARTPWRRPPACPDRVPAVGVLGGVVPSVGPDAPPGGWVGFAKRFSPCCRMMRHPSGVFLTAAVRLAQAARARRPSSSTPASRRPATARCCPVPT